MLRLHYESNGFTPRRGLRGVRDGSAELSFTWDDVLHAAITVGRPSWYYVFRHGTASAWEALFRWSLVRLALQQRSPRATRLTRTAASKWLDPTEKGAVNYFLGLVFAKLFASRLLDTPWLLHLDVFRDRLNPVISGRSRPDLIGQTKAGRWLVMECKGRATKPDAGTMKKAKDQAKRVISVSGQTPLCAIAAVTYFKGDVLQFRWDDPKPDAQDSKSLMLHVPVDSWEHHYRPVTEVLETRRQELEAMASGNHLVHFEEPDLKIGVHQQVLILLLQKNWQLAHDLAVKIGRERMAVGGFQPDGIRIEAGPSWQRAFKFQPDSPV